MLEIHWEILVINNKSNFETHAYIYALKLLYITFQFKLYNSFNTNVLFTFEENKIHQRPRALCPFGYVDIKCNNAS